MHLNRRPNNLPSQILINQHILLLKRNQKAPCLRASVVNNGHSVLLSLGSIASRKPSPMMLYANTVKKIMSPGAIASHQRKVSAGLPASFNMLPHDGVGGSTPIPRKLKID